MPVSAEKREAAVFCGLGSTLPEKDTRLIERPGWHQLLTPSAKDISLNEVKLSLLPPSTADRDVARIVDETLQGYREHSLPFKWAIGPMSSPDSLEAALAPQASESWWFRGMAIDSDRRAPLPPGVTVERVDSSNLGEFAEVSIRGWRREARRSLFERNFARMIAPDSAFRLYLARVGGVAAATAATVLKPGYGYLIAAVVLEPHRGRGAYRALIHARLGDLEKMGLPFAVTQARESTSAPILERLGFETAYRAKIYRFG